MIAELISIRRAVLTDEPAVRACVEDAYGLYLERMTRAPAPMEDDYRALIARGVVHVATRSDGLVGLIVLWPEDDHLFIDNIAVRPEAQGQGVAARLLDFSDGLARSAGQSEIRLYTNEVMAENLDYYPRRGFVETHRQLDRGYHRVYFSRRVPPSPAG